MAIILFINQSHGLLYRFLQSGSTLTISTCVLQSTYLESKIVNGVNDSTYIEEVGRSLQQLELLQHSSIYHHLWHFSPCKRAVKRSAAVLLKESIKSRKGYSKTYQSTFFLAFGPKLMMHVQSFENLLMC